MFIKMNETISVIVPNYNNEKYLEDCVESIIKQTYPILEVVFVITKGKKRAYNWGIRKKYKQFFA